MDFSSIFGWGGSSSPDENKSSDSKQPGFFTRLKGMGELFLGVLMLLFSPSQGISMLMKGFGDLTGFGGGDERERQQSQQVPDTSSKPNFFERIIDFFLGGGNKPQEQSQSANTSQQQSQEGGLGSFIERNFERIPGVRALESFGSAMHRDYNSGMSAMSHWGSNIKASILDLAQIHRESGGNMNAISRTGARGLMQLEPGTANEMAKRLGMEYNPERLLTDANYNIRLGHEYQQVLIKRYNGNVEMAMAAYNAGPGAVDKAVKQHGGDWLSHLSEETRNYVPKVMATLQNLARGQVSSHPLEVASVNTHSAPLPVPRSHESVGGQITN